MSAEEVTYDSVAMREAYELLHVAEQRAEKAEAQVATDAEVLELAQLIVADKGAPIYETERRLSEALVSAQSQLSSLTEERERLLKASETVQSYVSVLTEELEMKRGDALAWRALMDALPEGIQTEEDPVGSIVAALAELFARRSGAWFGRLNNG